uniref:Uncharacterized protein n=1 Tax=Anopheles farauti TaxID=69004 RepID=A0A182QTI6_9DIPT
MKTWLYDVLHIFAATGSTVHEIPTFNRAAIICAQPRQMSKDSGSVMGEVMVDAATRLLESYSSSIKTTEPSALNASSASPFVLASSPVSSFFSSPPPFSVFFSSSLSFLPPLSSLACFFDLLLAGVAGFGFGSIDGSSTSLPMFLRSCIFCIASATSSSAQAESTTGLTLPSFHSPKILSTVARTYSEPSCW